MNYQDKLLLWYSKQHSFHLDLVGDYAGTSRFLIHGDSLLRHCFSDPRIDFSPGFQLVHAVYVVEQFLQNLIRRRCMFDIVFLDKDARVCLPPGGGANSEKWLCARAVLMRHLMGLSGKHGETRRFTGLKDGDFVAWIRDRRPIFIMAVDGEDVAVENEEEDKFILDQGEDEVGSKNDEIAGDNGNEGGDEHYEPKEWEIKALVLRLMRVGDGCNISLINYVEFRDSKIFTHVLEYKTLKNFDDILPEYLFDGAQEIVELQTPPAFEIPVEKAISSSRDWLSICTLLWVLKLSDFSKAAIKYASLHLLHMAFLKHLSLNDRQWSPLAGNEHTNQVAEMMQYSDIQKQFAVRSTSLLTANVPVNFSVMGDLCDFIDGQLLLRIFIGCLGVEGIPEPVQDDFQNLASALERGCKAWGRKIILDIEDVTCKNLPTTKTSQKQSRQRRVRSGTHSVPTQPFATSTSAQIQLLPFSNPVFNPFLESIKLDIDILSDDDSDESYVQDGQTYFEKNHWHNAKKPLTYMTKRTPKAFLKLNPSGKGQPESIWAKRRLSSHHRSDQFQSSRMQRYAASLTDSIDGSLDPKLIICETTTNGKRATQKEPHSSDRCGGKLRGQKKENKPLSKAEGIRQQNLEKNASKKVNSLKTEWQHLCKEMEATSTEDVCLSKLDSHRRKLQRYLTESAPELQEAQFIELDIRLYKIWLLQKIWISRCMDKKTKKSGHPVVAAIFDEARRALVSKVLTIKAQKILKNVFSSLEIEMPPTKEGPLMKRELGFKTSWDGTGYMPCTFGMSSEEFQLLYYGQHMDRNMDSKPDPRVPFEPDRWQREVLDEIDSDNSVFVVAPTSAGKTFISFHAMEKVLKANDDGILVYVAPTKALANQIAAEVISRFRKNYKHSGKTVWAIHTRDYRINNPSECQILITVPHILSIMLLSPSNASAWSPRVRRIIFDEVHCIGNAEDGVIWEQLLLLAPCPIIALSATIGNPAEFNDWIQSTQHTRGIKLRMIQHPHRYSDLRKFAYQPPVACFSKKHAPFEGLQKIEKFQQLESIPGMKSIHPIAALIEPSSGIPDDLALEPKDCLELYRSMKRVETKTHPVPSELAVHTIFGSSGNVIRKVDVLRWEASLKGLLDKWMRDELSPFRTLLQALGSRDLANHLKSRLAHAPTVSSGGNKAEVLRDPAMELMSHVLNCGTLSLLSNLHSKNALPAILFSYDRWLCEVICSKLCLQLKEGEEEWRSNSSAWKATIEGWESWKKNLKSRAAIKARTVTLESGSTQKDLIREAAEHESSVYASFDPRDPSPGFSFADTKKCGKAQLKEEINNLNVAPMLIEALKRGIGVHHSGMNLKYRQCIETLFRKGYLRVIIATGTLALGINMPCKTVVFAGDSVYLTALNYRQAAGRAGRRGFDLIGNVIFHGIPGSRIQRLISSRLPSLMGHFPISTSLVLRLFILLNNSCQSEHAKKSIQSLLTQPRLVIGGDSFREQVLHHLRFSIEFLRRQHLLSADGTPLNFAGLATHLYYTETSAFSFHTLLCSGYFTGLCKDVHNVNAHKRICLDLMLAMAHLFGRKPAPKSEGTKALPPLPKKAVNILKRHNVDTLNTYSAYVETFAKQYCSDTPDNILPFSGQACGGPGLATAVAASHKSTATNIARSSFVALSGRTGCFNDLPDLITSIRSGIFLEAGPIPYFPVGADAPERINSYLYSFFKDGDTAKMERENRIRKGDIWFLLKDFSLILATVVAALTSYLKDGQGMYFETGGTKVVDEDGEEIPGLGRVHDESDDKGGGEGGEGGKGFAKVLAGFQMVHREFDKKFSAMFA